MLQKATYSALPNITKVQAHSVFEHVLCFVKLRKFQTLTTNQHSFTFQTFSLLGALLFGIISLSSLGIL